MRTPPLALLALLLVSFVPAASAAPPVKAAYFYGYMNRDHLDSLKSAGFNRAVIKCIGDSLTPARQAEFKAWLAAGNRVPIEIAAAWSIQAPSRVASRPSSRRYTWAAGNVETGMGCPMDSLFWKTALYDRAVEMLNGVPGLTRLHVDLESYTGTLTHYDAGPCRCSQCLADYVNYIRNRPLSQIPLLEEYQEARLVGILGAWLSRLASAYPNLELGFFDLDLDSHVHRALCRALAASHLKTLNFTERTYRTGAASVPFARGELDKQGLSAPLIGGIHLQLFSPAALPNAIRSLLASADGCFVFTTYSLWQQPDKLTGPYTLPGSQADYWAALGESFSQPDLAPSALTVTPDPVKSDQPCQMSFTIANRGRQSAANSRWTLSSDGVVIAQGDATVGAGKSLLITESLPAGTFAGGSRTLRVTADALGALGELDETNNVSSRAVTVTAPPQNVPPPPLRIFPVAPVVDDFDRSSGAVGGYWTGSISGVVISSQRFKPGSSSYITAIWDGTVMGENQEAFVTFEDVTSSGPRQGLLLKVQGRTYDTGALEVRYDGSKKMVFVATYTPGTGWLDRGVGIPVTIASGNVLGARVYRTGEVEVYRNGTLIGVRSMAGWAFANRGGRIGLTLEKSSSTRFDDFGGGSLDGALTVSANRAPTPQASGAPVTGAAPLTVQFTSAGSSDPDGEALSYEWSFGDGAVSVDPAPSHAYAAGIWRAVLTVRDVRGSATSDTVAVTVTANRAFPSSTVLDDFNRSSGSLGAKWVGGLQSAVISSKKLKPGSSAYVTAIWDDATFGEDQEAFVKITDLASSGPRQGLLLKVQGKTFDTGALEVRYDHSKKMVFVATYTPGAGWQDRGAGIALKISTGDVLGARAYKTGEVEVFHRGKLIGSRSVAGWIFANRGGRIGLTVENASSTRFDDFGGGTLIGLTALQAMVDPTSTRLSGHPLPDAPAELSLRGAAPNPFARETSIHFGLPAQGAVNLGVFDVQGRHLATLASGTMRAGWHSVRWSGTDRSGTPVSAGVYFVRLQFGHEAQVKRIVMTR